MSEFVGLISVLWGLCLLPALPVCLVVWILGRKRVQWNLFDFLVLVLPYVVWLVLLRSNVRCKTMVNFCEVFYLGLAVDLAPIIRLVLPKKWNGQIIAAILLIVACAVGAGIYLSVPDLPE